MTKPAHDKIAAGLSDAHAFAQGDETKGRIAATKPGGLRVLVCGGRTYSDARTMFSVLTPLDIAIVIHGGATGADAIAARYARANNISVKKYAADWRKYGHAAGPIRNQRMLDDGKPDLVVAFPGGAGTADMVRRAMAANINVVHALTPAGQAARRAIEEREADE